MKIFLASDHAGFTLKNELKNFLIDNHYSVEDCGALSLNNDDDYPDFISILASKVLNEPNSLGLIFGGSGQGEAIVANKFKGIRCALYYGAKMPLSSIDVEGNKSEDKDEILKLSKVHNNANVLSIAARFVDVTEAKHAVLIWLNTPYTGLARHQRRINKITQIEQKT